MRPRTFDILDKEFHEWCDNDFKIRKRNYEETILLDLKNWEEYYKKLEPYSLNWAEFKYDNITDLTMLDQIISYDYSGLYMFIIRPNNPIFDMPKNVFYIGMSGENNTGRPVRDRIKDYYSISKLKKRDAVMRLMVKYYPNVYIAYAYCDLTYDIIKQLESDLIGFFYPICNKDDFPVKLRPEIKAF